MPFSRLGQTTTIARSNRALVVLVLPLPQYQFKYHLA